MLIDELRKRPSFAAKTNDEEVVAHVDHLVSEAGRVSGLETENTELKARIADFEKKKRMRPRLPVMRWWMLP